MIESSYSLYKLIVLYIMDQVTFPVSDSQLSELILEKEYTSWMHLREVLVQMQESELIRTEMSGNTTYYHMTDQGRQTLRFFSGEISHEIRDEIRSYLKEHAYEMRSEAASRADYELMPNGDYAVHCSVREAENTLLELTVSLPTRRMAETACENWRNNSQSVYDAILKGIL